MRVRRVWGIHMSRVDTCNLNQIITSHWQLMSVIIRVMVQIVIHHWELEAMNKSIVKTIATNNQEIKAYKKNKVCPKSQTIIVIIENKRKNKKSTKMIKYLHF